MILKILSFLFIFIFCSSNAFCSAWTRKNGDSLVIFEMLNESTYSKTLFVNTNDDYYKTTAYKVYFEYGMVDKITLGGYLKNYNFYSQYLADGLKISNKIKNDYYANIFILQNIYNKNNNLFSLQYSIYAPLSYDDVSEYINPIDTKYSVELSVLYGIDDEISYRDLFLKYFINTGLSYRLVRELKYDQLDFSYLMGFRLNESSSFSASYECKYYFKNGLIFATVS